MSQVNWDEHRVKFAELRANGNITIKEYSEQNGLSFNTARKQLNLKKTAAAATVAAKSSVKKGSKAGDHSADHLSKSDKKIPAKGANNTRKKANKETEFTNIDTRATRKSFRAPPQKRSVPDGRKTKQNSDVKNPGEGIITKDHSEKIPRKAPQTRRKKSAKAAVTEMIPSTGEEVTVLPVAKEARKMLGEGPDEHMRLVIEMSQETILRYRDSVNAEADRLQEEIDELGDGEPEGVHPAQRLRGVLEDAAYLMNDFTSRLASIYQGERKLRQSEEKQRLAERQQAFKEAEAREKLAIARLQAEQRGREIEYRMGAEVRASRIIGDAIRMREREQLDDIGVAEYIERQGVSVPMTLAALARKAIEAIEPPVSDDVVDDEQIERDAQEFARLQREHPEWLAKRRAEVAKVVEDLGCGDIDATGERKAGEFEGDNEDLDLDPSATSDIYGDYDAPDDGYDEDDEIPISPPGDD